MSLMVKQTNITTKKLDENYPTEMGHFSIKQSSAQP